MFYSIWDDSEADRKKMSKISHPSFKAPSPDSLVSLTLEHQKHDASAYIAFGRARNSLGLTLLVPPKRRHLVGLLIKEGIKYRLED